MAALHIFGAGVGGDTAFVESASISNDAQPEPMGSDFVCRGGSSCSVKDDRRRLGFVVSSDGGDSELRASVLDTDALFDALSDTLSQSGVKSISAPFVGRRVVLARTGIASVEK